MTANEAIKGLKTLAKEFSGYKPNEEMFDMAISALNGIEKAARKLAWVHQQIDLYGDREDLHDEEYWLKYLTDPTWGDPDTDWIGEEES